MSKIILVTGASSGLGAATAHALAEAGHITYAGMGAASGHPPIASEPDWAAGHLGARPRPIALDVADQRAVSAAVTDITAEAGRIDCVVHTMGSVPRGPIESFTPYQLAQIYDANVLSTQRVNRAVLPQMRERQDGLLVWVAYGGGPADEAPYLALHSEGVAVIGHLAASYARELAGFGVEATVVVAGLTVPETGRRLRLVLPDDLGTARAYEGRYPGLVDRVDAHLADQAATAARLARAAQAVAAVVDSPKGTRPPRVTAGAPGDRLPGTGDVD
ncbi:SDR family NAD(P)-dependent oxidoreductase [Actinacidiphila glaucinigra]|uniref:SDR family NAD(P)-dependent oxidoreductase n=1 Tax=Actinacidiphila glaucinigra TaxID=235986 RepID=UPI00325402BD